MFLSKFSLPSRFDVSRYMYIPVFQMRHEQKQKASVVSPQWVGSSIRYLAKVVPFNRERSEEYINHISDFL